MLKKIISWMCFLLLFVVVFCIGIHFWQNRWKPFSAYFPELKGQNVQEITLIRVGDMVFPISKKTESLEEAFWLLEKLGELRVRPVDAAFEEASDVDGGKDYIRIQFENGEMLEFIIFQYIGLEEEERFFKMKTNVFMELWENLQAEEEEIPWDGVSWP